MLCSLGFQGMGHGASAQMAARKTEVWDQDTQCPCQGAGWEVAPRPVFMGSRASGGAVAFLQVASQFLQVSLSS